MPRPNRAINAMKKRDYPAAMWELLLYEYRMAKAGNTTHRLGGSSVNALISAIKDIETEKIDELKKEDSISVQEIEAWLKETKN